jgi:enterochelin esterase-like enzyme
MYKYLLASFISILFFSCGPKLESTSTLNVEGKIDRLENFESKYIRSRTIDVWLPENYSRDEDYSVLYMHDGQMLFDSTNNWNKQEWGVDEMMNKLIQNKSIKKSIVVGIWNTEDRHGEYFPQKPFENLPISFQESLTELSKRKTETSLPSLPVNSDNYLKFLVLELKPFIDNKYSTIAGRDNTYILGSSMGGLISMYAICEYPEVFGGAACLSTHWIGTLGVENSPIPTAFVEYMKENLPNPKSHRFYFDYGTETLDSLYEPFQNQVDSVMLGHGYEKNNWITLKFEGSDHSERSWKKRLDIPLKFMLGTN